MESLGHYPLVVATAYAAVLTVIIIATGINVILKILKWGDWREWGILILKVIGVTTWIIIVLSALFFITMWLKS